MILAELETEHERLAEARTRLMLTTQLDARIKQLEQALARKDARQAWIVRTFFQEDIRWESAKEAVISAEKEVKFRRELLSLFNETHG